MGPLQKPTFNSLGKRQGYLIKAITSMAMINASRRRGLRGQSMATFLGHVLEELITSDDGKRVSVEWPTTASAAPDGAAASALHQWLTTLPPVPFLRLGQSSWPSALVALDNVVLGALHWLFPMIDDRFEDMFQITTVTARATGQRPAAEMRRPPPLLGESVLY